MGINLKIKRNSFSGIPYMGNSSEPCLKSLFPKGRDNVFSGAFNGNYDFC
jgi:hypothetical protein